MALTFGSLFSGIGGFDRGFERAGIQCAWQVEIDAKARQVLDKHWPDVPKVEDVRDVKRYGVPEVDVICGGFPCQDVSIAGNRKGLDGDKSGLWFEFYRVIRELHPRWVVIENAPYLLSSNGGRDFTVILSGLVRVGFRVAWRVLDTQYFGLAQRRRRLFIVASLGDGRAAQVLFEYQSVQGDTAESQPTTAAAAPANGGSDTVPGGGILRNRIEIFDARGIGNGRLSNTLVGDHMSRVTDYTPLICDYENGIRRLIPLECERLQGFPDGWTEGQADGPRYRQLGNAVAVPVAEWIGRRIVGLMEASK